MTDNKNTILAIALSALVLIVWQYFFAMPQEKARQERLQQEQAQALKQNPAKPAQPGQPATQPGAPMAPGQTPGQAPGQAPQTSVGVPTTRAAALAASARVPIATESLQGSIALKGGRIDDLALVKFRETVDPKSPPIELLSPSGSPEPFYAEFGWTNAAGANVKVPDAETVWAQVGSGALSVSHPVTLSYDNGQGQEFRRTISVDDKYLFSVKDEVVNKGDKPVTLYPFALISRHGTPKIAGLLHLARRPDRQVRRQEFGGNHLQENRRKQSHELQRHRCVARHNRQILGRGAAAENRRPCDRAISSRTNSAPSRPIRPTICSTR